MSEPVATRGLAEACAEGVGVSADPWLARVLARPVFVLTLGAYARPRDLREQLDTVRRPGAMCWVKVPADRTDAVRALEDVGFSVVDTSLTFARPAAVIDPGGIRPDVEVLPVRSADHAEVLDIASTAFTCSRFHLDPALSRPLADHVKRAWIESCLAGERGEELLVALVQGRPVGFLAVLASQFRGAPSRTIDLMAVHPGLARRGFGRALVTWFARRYAGRVEHLVVGTQAANVAAVRCYETLGFKLVAAAYVLHLHVPASPRRPRCA